MTSARREGGFLAYVLTFVIPGRSDAKRRDDPGIHAITSTGECYGAELCTTAALRSHGMDTMVCAASLRSLLRHRMTK
ncbi:conserved hypothetical protein [Mesorhizobium sp. STM 4661]|nr:conserved hypothetical protein [Mesorhizobium sp. STM 4661]